MIPREGGGMNAGLKLLLRIGQRVSHRDYKGKRITGTVREISLDAESGLMVGIVLDAPIRIANDPKPPIEIWHQHAPAHEFSPFDERDELIAELLDAAQQARAALSDLLATGDAIVYSDALRAVDAAIAKANA